MLVLSAQDDVLTPRQRPPYGFMSLSAHDEGLAHGKPLEAFQVVRQTPRQAAVGPDHPVLVHGDDERYLGRRNGRGDSRMGLIVEQLKVLVAEVEDRVHFSLELHARRGEGLPSELQLRLLQVISVQVGVPQGVDERAGLEAGDLSDHQGQQGVGGDVERHPEENIGAALVQLAGQRAIAHIKLKQGVAGRQGHLVQLRHIPGADQQAPGVRVVFDLLHHPGDLVYDRAVGAAPGTPLRAIDGTQFALLVGPFVPDGNAVVLQITDVRVAPQEP